MYVPNRFNLKNAPFLCNFIKGSINSLKQLKDLMRICKANVHKQIGQLGYAVNIISSHKPNLIREKYIPLVDDQAVKPDKSATNHQ
jgi:hypothetical protein